MEDLLTGAELAELLKIPRQTLYRWRHRGEGPRAITIGKHTRYRRSDVEAWLESKASGAA